MERLDPVDYFVCLGVTPTRSEEVELARRWALMDEARELLDLGTSIRQDRVSSNLHELRGARRALVTV